MKQLSNTTLSSIKSNQIRKVLCQLVGPNLLKLTSSEPGSLGSFPSVSGDSSSEAEKTYSSCHRNGFFFLSFALFQRFSEYLTHTYFISSDPIDWNGHSHGRNKAAAASQVLFEFCKVVEPSWPRLGHWNIQLEIIQRSIGRSWGAIILYQCQAVDLKWSTYIALLCSEQNISWKVLAFIPIFF